MSNTGGWFESLSAALQMGADDPTSRYLQLATIGLDGGPRNRTIVFRGFADDSSDLLAVTDARSDKFEELQEQPQAELCWYFTAAREQFRLRATVQLLTADAGETSRQALWSRLSESASEQFFWAHPGEVVGSVTALPAGPDAPAHFVGLRFAPHHVDHLCLRTPQTRTRWQMVDGTWFEAPINP